MKELSLAQRMRTGQVKRWHIVRVGREQSIAEHMYLVWVLTTELCHRMGIDERRSFIAQQWALLHDQPEVIIGDLPTPTKIALRGQQQSNLDMLEEGTSKIVSDLSDHIRRECPEVFYIVKLMDLVESLWFLQTEAISRHAAEVGDYLRGIFKQKLAEAREEHPVMWWDRAETILREILETT